MKLDFLAWPLATFKGDGALQPTCAPGGNFALEHWNLQLPVGNSRGVFETKPSQVLQGCCGWSDYMFYTDTTTGCVTTPGSFHCRTELREIDALTRLPMTWSMTWSPISAKNLLRATLKVVRADDGWYGTVIGEIFASWPLLEIFYSLDGHIVLGIKSGQKERQVMMPIGNVPLDTLFDYDISYSLDQLVITVDGNQTHINTTNWGSQLSYFKIGNYNQARSARHSEVHIAKLQVIHE